MPLRLAPILICLCLVAGGCAAEATAPQDEQGEASAAQTDEPTPKRERNKPEPREPERATEPAPERKTKRKRIGTAAWMLARVKTRPESGAASYERDLFGSGWRTRNGCTTRQWVLIAETRRGSETGCLVRRGLWVSVYDGERVRDPSDLDVDHLVPLEQAWVSGARRWTSGTRRNYANDLGYAGTLRAVTASTNRSKGGADPADWMPPRQIHHCKYIGTWIAVKYRWRLSADPAERRVLARYVKRCGRKSDVPIPRRAAVRRR